MQFNIDHAYFLIQHIKTSYGDHFITNEGAQLSAMNTSFPILAVIKLWVINLYYIIQHFRFNKCHIIVSSLQVCQLSLPTKPNIAHLSGITVLLMHKLSGPGLFLVRTIIFFLFCFNGFSITINWSTIFFNKYKTRYFEIQKFSSFFSFVFSPNRLIWNAL